jgi:hypothetical protein
MRDLIEDIKMKDTPDGRAAKWMLDRADELETEDSERAAEMRERGQKALGSRAWSPSSLT